jgi:hypothetical protein
MIAGGRVIVPRTEIPNFGFFAMFLDSENNIFGLFEKRRWIGSSNTLFKSQYVI